MKEGDRVTIEEQDMEDQETSDDEDETYFNFIHE